MCLIYRLLIGLLVCPESEEKFLFALLQGKKERLYLQSLLRNGFQKVCSLKVL